MYNGTNQTALTSQKNIADAFVLLLHKTPYSKITVSAICKEADVSRQTFYSLFESKDNIVVYLLDKKHSFNPGKQCSCDELSLEGISSAYSCYITERTDFLSLLVENDLTYLLHDSLYESFLTCSCFLPDQQGLSRRFTAEFVASGLSGIIRTYIQYGQQLGRDELTEMICHLFSGDYLKTAT